MELDKICQNCSSFFQDSNDYNIGLGVCLNDPDDSFEPYIDEIIENADFSNIYEIYLEKRFNGGREACEQFEEPEFIELQDGEDLNDYIYIENMKQQNVDEVIKYLYDNDNNMVNRALSTISPYVHIGNENAYKGLIEYYMGLGPADNLEDVYIRIKIVDLLSSKKSEKKTIDAYVNELARTPSNNTTRQLYTEILEHLRRCPWEMVMEPLLELLDKKKFSYKMKKKIMDIAIEEKIDEYWYR
jgi:hypothetical protein